MEKHSIGGGDIPTFLANSKINLDALLSSDPNIVCIRYGNFSSSKIDLHLDLLRSFFQMVILGINEL